VEAHQAFERFERSRSASSGNEPSITTRAALTVAVLAGFLAIASFLANDAVKRAIQSETRVADAHSQRNAFETEQEVAKLDAHLEGSMAASSDAGLAQASKSDEKTLKKDSERLQHQAATLAGQVSEARGEVNHANDEHLLYELAVVLLQIGIVLASVSIIARRGFLLGGGVVAGIVGVVVLVVGVIH
jgi:hypothetical protein